jgi:hypothetical protein
MPGRWSDKGAGTGLSWEVVRTDPPDRFPTIYLPATLSIRPGENSM